MNVGFHFAPYLFLNVEEVTVVPYRNWLTVVHPFVTGSQKRSVPKFVLIYLGRNNKLLSHGNFKEIPTVILCTSILFPRNSIFVIQRHYPIFVRTFLGMIDHLLVHLVSV